MTKDKACKRILLKLSGEALAGEAGFGFSQNVLGKIAGQIKDLIHQDMELAIVVGGGNLFRGAGFASEGAARITGDHVGMLATVMNGLMLSEVLREHAISARVFSAIAMPQIACVYHPLEACAALSQKQVAILVGGTGNPYFTTDATAALRAIECQCDLLLKATQVDGVYSADPKTNREAERYDRVSYDKALRDNLGVMDSTAFALARDNNLPIAVFALEGSDSLVDIAGGRGRFTLVGNE